MSDDNKPRYTRKRNNDDGLELVAIKSFPFRELTHKPISQFVCERFGVRVAVSEEDGQPQRVYYPYHDQDGNVTGYKVRHLPKDFAVVGKIKGLFGQKQCKPGAKLLIITEGEDDALAAYQMLIERGKNWNVVSIPNGANREGKVDPQVAAEIEFITSHQLVVLALDNDAPGQATANAIAEMIVSQCRVKVLKLPRKDAGQMLIDGMGDQFLKELHTNDYSPAAVVRGSDILFDDLRKKKPSGYSLPYPDLDRKLHGLRKGEITTLCAGSGIGKSTLTREIAYHLVKEHGLTVATIALETAVDDAARAYLAIDMNVPLYRLSFNPDSVDHEQYEESFQRLIASDKMHFFKHWGSIESQKLVQKMHYMVKALGVDFIVLDHVSMVVASGAEIDERKSLDALMENLTKLVVETGVGVVAVVHLKRVQGKNYNKGDEVELVDLRGSAGIEQMSWTVIGVERDQQSDTKKDMSRLRVLKNRTIGFTGKADTLMYHHDTGRLLPASVDYQ